jgi:hypothetical protein
VIRGPLRYEEQCTSSRDQPGPTTADLPERGRRIKGFLSTVGRTIAWSLPVLLPLLLAAASLLIADSAASEASDIVWAFFAIPVLGVVGAWARVAEATSPGEQSRGDWANALGAALIGIVPAYFIWYQALEATCHGAYECPF